MHIDDISIRSIIEKHQINPSDVHIKHFIEHTYHFVQNWPKMQFSCNEDVCHDFLLYVIERIENILFSFPIQTKVLFKTWFSSVLYHKFVDFVKEGEVTIEFLSIDDNLIKREPDNNSILLLGSYFDDIEHIFEKMAYEDQAFVFFYYFPDKLTPDHLICIADTIQKDVYDVLLCYQELMQQYYKNNDQSTGIYKKIDKIDSEIAHMYNIIKKNSCKDIFLIEEKIARFKNKRDKYLRYLRKMNQGFMKVFSQLFNDYNTAYRKIRNLEKKIKQIILQ